MEQPKRISVFMTINVPEAILTIKPDEIVFISGPMTGYPNFNRAAFAKMEFLLKTCCGCRVLNPGRREDGHEYEWYMDRCVEDIYSCTTVVFLERWFQSPGSRREFALALFLNRKIVFTSKLHT